MRTLGHALLDARLLHRAGLYLRHHAAPYGAAPSGALGRGGE